jgi:hypothetical protein
MKSIFFELSQALPSSFNFYHLGTIELQSSPPQTSSILEDQAVIGLAFKLNGDLNASFILLVEPDLDLSIYSEVGNILASKLVNQLYSSHNLQVGITPPYQLSYKQIIKIMGEGSPFTRQTYFHVYENQIIQLETLLVPHNIEGAGNA